MRLTGGGLCGRTIAAPKGNYTRPTQDRVRESLFAILGNRVEGSNVLDMFAGSGSLGFESLSRGAISCTFVDISRHSLRIIEDNAGKLDITGRCTFHAADALRQPQPWVSSAPFDLVFVDPPYSSGVYNEALGLLAKEGIINPFGVIVVEKERKLELPERIGKLVLKRTERYGSTVVDFYQECSEE